MAPNGMMPTNVAMRSPAWARRSLRLFAREEDEDDEDGEVPVPPLLAPEPEEDGPLPPLLLPLELTEPPVLSEPPEFPLSLLLLIATVMSTEKPPGQEMNQLSARIERSNLEISLSVHTLP